MAQVLLLLLRLIRLTSNLLALLTFLKSLLVIVRKLFRPQTKEDGSDQKENTDGTTDPLESKKTVSSDLKPTAKKKSTAGESLSSNPQDTD